MESPRRLVPPIVIAAFFVAMAIAALVAINSHDAGQNHQTGPMINEPINVMNLPSQPIDPVEPDFTGGPSLQPNMGTKPPAVSPKPSASIQPVLPPSPLRSDIPSASASGAG